MLPNRNNLLPVPGFIPLARHKYKGLLMQPLLFQAAFAVFVPPEVVPAEVLDARSFECCIPSLRADLPYWLTPIAEHMRLMPPELITN